MRLSWKIHFFNFLSENECLDGTEPVYIPVMLTTLTMLMTPALYFEPTFPQHFLS